MAIALPLILLDLAAAAALVLAAEYALKTRELARPAAAFAAAPLACAALLGVYVLSEDDYRGSGISRWDAYTSPGGALAAMTYASVTILSLGGLLLAYSARRDRRLFAYTAIVLALALLLLVIPTTIGFSNN